MDTLHLLRAIRTNDCSVSSLRIPSGIPPRALADALSQNTTLTQLVLTGIADYDLAEFCEVLEAVSNTETLRTLDLSQMDLDDEFLSHVADFVAHCPSLVRLDVSNNIFSPAAGAVLGAAVKLHPALRIVSLENCGLGSSGCVDFLETVTPAGCLLHRISIAHNKVIEADANRIAAFVQANVSLLHINTNGNFFPASCTARMKKQFAENAEKLAARQALAVPGGEIGFLLQFATDNGELHLLPNLRMFATCLATDL